MNKYIVAIFFAIFISFSCNHGGRNVHKASASDEGEITTLVFDASVYPDTTYKKMVLVLDSARIKFGFSIAIKPSATIQEESKHELDSLRKKLDTATIYVLLADSLLDVQTNSLSSEFLNKTRTKRDIDTDSIFNIWRKEIIIDQKSDQFDFAILSSKYHYKFKLKSKFHQSNGGTFIAGAFSMSPIFFNKKKDKAFVYSTFVCGGLCGGGQDIYLAKLKGKWEIVRKVSDWVS